MKWICTILLLAAGCFMMPVLVYAQTLHPEESDVIEFMDGDQISGKVKQIQRGELSLDPDKLEDLVTIKLRNIKSITARRKLYRIESVANIRYLGILEPGRGPGWVKIIQEKDTTELFIEDLDNIENMDDNFWKRLDGSASLGFSYSRSSNIGRVNESHNMTYSTKNWLFLTSGDLMYTIDNEFKGIEKADLAVQAYIEFWKKWFAVSSVQFQRSTELGLSARMQLAEGAGPILIKSRKNDLRAATGFSIQKEYSTDSTDTNRALSAEIPLFVNYYLYELGTPYLTLQATNSLFFSLSQKGRWRVDQSITLYWKIVTHLNLNVQFYFDYDSKPPDVSAQKVDFGTVFSIGYSW
ncbi:DUF481 domain-containing protein [Chitinophaga sp. CC14]|uniref:DUF481 domain-containing protein n=1 Tax=Chitinophaga sp. CC14 TaxID=3029199 RepID=UPI003B763DEE